MGEAMRCPRCGREGRFEVYEVNGRKYLRVVHGSGKSRERCYLGPVESYSRVGPLLSLHLHNLKDIDYAVVVQSAVDRLLYLAKRYGLGEEAKEWHAKVKRVREVMERELERVRKLEKELERLAKSEEARLEAAL